MTSRYNYDDDDEELGAYIYQTSHTAKLFREKGEAAKALVSKTQRKSPRLATKCNEVISEKSTIDSNIYQTRRKSPRLLATKSKPKEQDIPTAVVMPEKSISNTNGSRTSKQRTTLNRKLVLRTQEV